MKVCNAITKNGTKCSKKHLAFSKYCFLHQDPRSWLYGVIIGAIIAALLTMWGIERSIDKQNKNIAEEKNNKRPNVEIIIEELTKNKIQVYIQASDSNLVPIETLFFKFDIPGTYISSDQHYSDNIESYLFANVFKGSVNNITTCETIFGQAKGILPNAYLTVNILFEPTTLIPISGRELLENSNYPTHYVPLMDLHDYSKIVYTWSFNGEIQIEYKYLDLTNLQYIQKDNLELVKKLKWHKDLQSVKIYENNRKDW